MKLSQFLQQISVLDDFTVKHLRDWCERYRPTSEDADTVCARMIVFIEGMDSRDREHVIARGWTVVFDQMEASK